MVIYDNPLTYSIIKNQDVITIKLNGEKTKKEADLKNHKDAFEILVKSYKLIKFVIFIQI